MLEVAVMVEGQNGLNWPLWQRIAQVAEESGFAGLYRSDHYTNANPPDLDSLECWVSLTWLASHTKRLQFGPLVSPVSFRHPTLTARMAAAVDDLSGGRLVLGMGAGWQEREHNSYGWDLLPVRERFLRFEEGLQVVTLLFNSACAVNFQGRYYQLKDAILLPRPQRPGGPTLLVGGNGLRRTLPLAARYAAEWNAVYLPPEAFSRTSTHLDELLIQAGRQPGAVRRSLMTGCVFGKNRLEVERKVAERTHNQRTPDELRQRGLVVGEAAEIHDQLLVYENAGVQRMMLQWLDLDNLDGLQQLASRVL